MGILFFSGHLPARALDELFESIAGELSQREEKGQGALNHSIEVIVRIEDLECLADQWQVLQWNHHHDMDWLLFKYAQVWCNGTPYVILLKKDARVESIVAGELKWIPLQFQIGYKRWQGPRLKTLFVHRYGFLAKSSDSTWRVIEKHLEQILACGEVEAVLLRDFELLGPPHTLSFPKLPWPCKFRTGILQEHWFVDCKEGLQVHKKKHRNFWGNVRKSRNKTFARFGGQMVFKAYSRPEDLEQIIEHTEQVAKKTWQRKLGGQWFTAPEVLERYRYFLGRGLLRANIFYLNGQPAAFFHGVKYVANFYAEVMGYDPAYAGLGVGTYLTGSVLETLFQEGTGGLVDFGVGNSEAKSRFCDTHFKTADLFLVAPKPRLMALNTLRVAFLSLHLCLKKALYKGGLYQKVRSAWRYSGCGR